MGEGKATDLEVGFSRRLGVQFHGAKVTSDAGLLAARELGEVHLAMSRQEESVSRSTNTALVKPSIINEESRETASGIVSRQQPPHQ